MKRLFTLTLLLLLVSGVYAKNTESQPRLTSEERLYGTWILSLSEMVGDANVPDMSIYLNFARNNKLYIHSSSVTQTGDYSLKLNNGATKMLKVQYECSINMTIDWSATDSHITFRNATEGKERFWVGNLYILNGYEQYSKYIPEIEEDIRQTLEFAKGLGRGSQASADDADVSAELKYHLVGDDGMQWQIEGVPTFNLKRYSLIKPTKSTYTLGQTIEFSYIDGGIVCDPDEYAFLSMSRYNENNEWASAWFSDTPTEPGTYRYMAEDDGYNSNMAIVRVVPSLQLNVYGYKATDERQRRIVLSRTDSTLVADRHKVIAENRVLIMPCDSVRFEVLRNGEDVTDRAKIYYASRGERLPVDRRTFDVSNSTFTFAAELDGESTNTVEVMTADSLHLVVNPQSVELWDSFGYSTFRGAHTSNPSDLKPLTEGVELRNECDCVMSRDGQRLATQSLGAYSYYATDGRVCSNPVDVVVVEPTPIELKIDSSTHRCFVERTEGEYFLQLDAKGSYFVVMQGDRDVTAESKIYNSKGELLQRYHDIRRSGLYEFYATKGMLRSKSVTLEIHDLLHLKYDRDKFDAERVVDLTAEQDFEDVTPMCRYYYHHHSFEGYKILPSNSHTPVDNGFYTYRAMREPIYRSFVRVVYVRDGKPIMPSGELVVEADRDTVILGDTLRLTTRLNGKPTKATIYNEDEEKISSTYIPAEPGEYLFIAHKGKMISEPLVILVLPKKEENSVVEE